MRNCPYCNKEFETWKSVRGHTAHCDNNTGEYFTDLNEGPIHYSEIIDLNRYQITIKYPELSSDIAVIRKNFNTRKNIDFNHAKLWNKKSIKVVIQLFYKENNRIPQMKDFIKTEGKYPGFTTVVRQFKTWNKAIEAAGFVANYDNGIGTRIEALDGVIYRSRYETDFVNKFLYNKYKYIVEPKYPEPYRKWYDWYLPKLDLYIELDGGLRPEITKEKIEINKLLNRKLLVIKPKDLNEYSILKEVIENDK